jgi:hypothetical protein
METRVTTTTRTRVQALGLGQAQPFLSGAAAYTLNASYNNAFTPTGFLTASTTYSSAVPTAGIHNSKQIFKIQLPGDALGNGSGIGTVTQYAITAGPFGGVSGWMPLTGYATGAIIVDSNGNIQQLTVNSGQSSGTTPNWATTLNGLTTDGSMGWTLINLKSAPNWQVAPYPQPIMGPEKDVISGVSITTSTPGFWTAKCQPICSLNIATAEMMPWNQNRTKYGSAGSASVNPMLLGDQAPIASTGPLANQAQVSGSYDQSKTVEGQLEPPVWKANTFFPPNFTILDPNGNLQKSGTGAVSGATAPSFANTKGVFTYDGGAPGPGTLVWNCIKVLKPASTWEAAQAYAVGQTVIDANGSAETVKTAGTSGGSAPNWSTVPDGLTTDGSVTWRRTSAWLLTAPVATIAPAQHRVPDIPRYPFYWFSETLARLKPPTNTSGPTIWGTNNQWQLNYYTGGYDAGWHQCYPASAGTPADTGGMAYGWFIYSVSINRNQYPVKTRQAPKAVGAGDLNTWWAGDDTGASGVGAGGAGTGPNAGPITDASEISVTIGCIRNGAFVSFGSFQTGQTYQVLWPVFTSDALVYQASERLDLQAMAITDGNSVGIGTVTPPVCAAFITDTINILNLIN